MLAETKIKCSKFTHPWSPNLAVAILFVTLWKLNLSSLNNTSCKVIVIKRIEEKNHTYKTDPIPTNRETKDKTMQLRKTQ